MALNYVKVDVLLGLGLAQTTVTFFLSVLDVGN